MRLLQRWLPAAAILLLVLVLYAPALSFQLMGDDYQWVQHADAALNRPVLLLSDLDSFYRPASTWTLALDHVVWGFKPLGFHLSNLILHGLAGIMLALVALRLGVGPVASWALALLWVSSPFSLEPAVSVAIRFQDLLLLAWLGLILGWPRRGDAWSPRRIAAVTACVLLSIASKETWVVTPLLVAALAWAQERRQLSVTLRVTGIFAAAAGVYTLVYFLAFPGDKGYFRYTPGMVAKVPHEFAAFLGFVTLRPSGFRFSWAGVAALAIVGVVVVWLFRRRDPAGVTGAALLVAPTLPVLLVPYLPTRYTAIPYAGFLLVAAAALSALAGRLPVRLRRPAAALALAVAALVLAVGSLTVRADLSDFRRVSDAHAELLREARRIAPGLPIGRPVLAIRAEHDSPLEQVALAPLGLPKAFFVRPGDPYGLVDTAALFEWARGDNRLLARPIRDWQDLTATPVTLLFHFSGSFRVLAPRNALQVARTWAARGAPVTAFTFVRLPAASAQRPRG